MTLKELLAKIAEKAEGVDFGFNIEESIAQIVNTAVEAVTNKNTELLGQMKKLKEKVANLPEDFSVEAWNKMKDDLSNVDTSKLKTDDAVAEVKRTLGESHAAELKTMQGTIDGLTTDLETQLVDNAVSKAIADSHGNTTLLLPHVKQQVKMVKGDDGKYAAQVVDANGNERFSMKKAGERMGVEELVGEFKLNDTYKSAFTSGNGGGGAGGSGGGGGEKNPFVKGPDFNMTEQAKLMNTHPEIGAQMKAAADSINNQQSA